jgi:predicted nucleic acid-binding protein
LILPLRAPEKSRSTTNANGGRQECAVAEVMKEYQEIRLRLADAALVYLANREGIGTIFTLDRRDFAVYRSAHKRSFHIVP